MPLDRERRPSVNNGAVIQAAGNLGRASQMPLDNSDVTAPWRAMGAVGDAVMRAGSVVGAMAQKAQEERSRTATIEAQNEMDIVAQSLGGFYSQNKTNTDAWEPQTTKAVEELKARFLKDQRLTALDKERLGAQMESWGKRQIIHAQTTGAATIYANSKNALSSRIANLRQAARFDEIPPLMEQAKASGAFYDWELEDEDFKTQQAVKAKTAEGINGRYSIAIDNADEALLNKTISEGKTALGWDKDYAEAKRLEGVKGIERTRTVNAARNESDFLGKVMMRKAQGEVFVPEQVDSWVAEKKIDAQTGARLRVALQSEVGAMTGEFMDFLNKEVDVYDPDSDPDGLKTFEIQKKADLLGLNQRQRELYSARLERAAKVNADPKLKPLEAVRRAAKSQIGEMFKDVGQSNVWSDNLSGALQDEAKLEAWGIDSSARKSILTTIRDETRKPEDRNQAALRIFKEASKNREDKTAAGLTEWEFELFNRAEKDDESTQFDAKFEGEFNRAVLEEAFDNWYDGETAKRGTPPSAVEARRWVGESTRAVIQGTGAVNFFKTSEVKPAKATTPATPATPGAIDEPTVSMIKDFESFIPEAYGDYKQTSVGYGTRARFDGEVLTEPEADARLRDELQGHVSRVDSLAAENGVKLTEAQRSALISFDFNTGAVHRVFERGGADTTRYAPIMKEWRKAGGKVLPGLVARRAKEAAAFE
jgi:GH24 family phage-related lysozyme (muramidase)